MLGDAETMAYERSTLSDGCEIVLNMKTSDFNRLAMHGKGRKPRNKSRDEGIDKQLRTINWLGQEIPQSSDISI